VERNLSREEFVSRLDGWVGLEVAVRAVGNDAELLLVVQGELGRRSVEKAPALFWPIPASSRIARAERPGVYLHPECFEGAGAREGEFVLELRQAGATLNIRRL
jgi:hypothetical protein